MKKVFIILTILIFSGCSKQKSLPPVESIMDKLQIGIDCSELRTHAINETELNEYNLNDENYVDGITSSSYKDETKFILIVRTNNVNKTIDILKNKFDENSKILNNKDIVVLINYNNIEEQNKIIDNFNNIDL